MNYDYDVEYVASDKELEINEARAAGFGVNPAWALIEPGTYFAVVKSIKVGEFQGNFKGVAEKVTFENLTPDVELINDNGTVINRQPFTFGAVRTVNGKRGLYNPDGSNGSPIWGGERGAEWLLRALGFLVTDPDTKIGRLTGFNPSRVTNRIVRARVNTGGYIKGSKNYSHGELHELLLDQNDGKNYEFSEVPALVDAYNNLKGYAPGKGLVAKNVLTGFFSVSEEQVKEHGWYWLDGKAYRTQADAAESVNEKPKGRNRRL